MKILNNSLYIHGLVIVCFAIFAQLFYYPSFSGMKMLQSDIVQYSGMSRQIKEYRLKNDNKESYWIDNAFGGMPTYQLGANYPADFLSPIHNLFRFIPRPAYILFLYLFSIYVLFIVLKIDWKLAILGSFAFGLSTYLLIILQVGHNTKAIAISYIPIALAGFFLLIQKKWIYGFVLSVIGLGLNIRANHYQMSYYLIFILIIFGLVYFVEAFKNKELKSIFKSLSLFFLSGVIAIGLNATPLLATSEYSEFSTRSGSELNFNLDGSPKDFSSGLDYNYITEYSYGIFESLNLIIPRIMGGGSRENLGTNSNIYDFLIRKGVPTKQAKEFVTHVPTYWGSQPILEAPAYIGVVVFVFALFYIILFRGPLRNALVLTTILSLILSWGKNFPLFTDFFINYIPYYNKFRAVSSAQIILEVSIPILSILGLQKLLNNPEKYFKKFFKILVGLISFLLSLILLKTLNAFSFSGQIDNRLRQAYGDEILDQIIIARSQIFSDDIYRAIYFLIAIFLIYILYKTKKFSKNITIISLLVIIIYDLGGVANRYLDWNQFKKPSEIEVPFEMTDADRIVLNDKSRFRVYEPEISLNGARTSFFHNSIGGYHGAKPRRFQELFQFFNYNQIPEVLDILNVKYVLNKGLNPAINNNAQGNAWFVNSILKVNSADEVLESFKTIDFKSEAVVEDNLALKALSLDNKIIDEDSSIKLVYESNNELKYKFESKQKQVVVFSEIYYPKGWQAIIDGEIVPHYRVNYILRALPVESGEHVITFRFNPEVVKKGTKFRYSSISLFVLILFSLVYTTKFQRNSQ